MRSVSKDKLFQRIKVLLYSSLLSLGLYWIFSGNSFSQYFSEKTSFAEFSEPLAELPTIHTYLNIPNRTALKYGEHFNISYGQKFGARTNLTFGENLVPGSPLKVDFEAFFDGSLFLITPINFSPGMSVDYDIIYTTASNFPPPPGNAIILLGTETDSYSIDAKYSSEAVLFEFGGSNKIVTVSAEKYKYLKALGKCTDQYSSYNEIWVAKTVEKMKENCGEKVCRPRLTLGKRLDKFINHLPFCQHETYGQCFLEAFNKTLTVKPKVLKPCKRIHYKGMTNIDPSGYGLEKKFNQASCRLQFKDPPMTTVKEEYLMYDYVGLVSSVGGTLGICVGISFYGVIETILDIFKWNTNCISRHI